MSGRVDCFVQTEDILINNCGARIEITFPIPAIRIDGEDFCVGLCCPDVAIVAIATSDFDVVNTMADRS